MTLSTPPAAEAVVLYAAADGVARATINRPARKNALNLAAYTGLIDAIARAEADTAVRALIITGAGGSFTSGNDLADFAAAGVGGPNVALDFLEAISTAAKPVIAAVEGHAVGIGTTMLLHCDFAYAGAGARFRLPFVNLGLTPEGGSSLLLPQLAGAKRAAELLMLGEEFTPAAALDAGLLTAVTDAGEALAAAEATAAKLCALPPEGMRLTKQLLKRDGQAALTETLRHEVSIFAKRLTSPEAQAAFARFLMGGKK